MSFYVTIIAADTDIGILMSLHTLYKYLGHMLVKFELNPVVRICKVLSFLLNCWKTFLGLKQLFDA